MHFGGLEASFNRYTGIFILENDKAIFEPIPLTEQTTGRNGLKFGMDAHFGKVFGAIEAFFEFQLRIRDMGYP